MKRRTTRGVLTLGVLAGMAAAVGCMNDHPRLAAHSPNPPITVPPPGSVPTALNMVALPEYVVEPPDVLLVEVVIRNLRDTDDKRLEELQKTLDDEKTAPEARQKAEQEYRKILDHPQYDGTVREVPYQPIRNNSFQVQPDGYIFLGVYGSVPVAGLTTNQVRQAIRSCVARQVFPEKGGLKEDALLVNVSVTQYNSKVYYVHTDGGGAGERVVPLPITGKESVSDAIARIGGLPQEASKRNIWVARRSPQLSADQILPVDWVGISQWGVTTTDYQLFPGDHVYVKAQRLVTVETTLSRVFAPVKELLGVTLLGTQTVNQIKGRGIGFGGNGLR